ncbi:MAG TPA: type IV pilus assembly protein PilM [Candidatus Atribacteria bacterium]|nr:type IV pilus assembly protein PilM [Candidatus Atribacteria bacterium]
MKGNKEKQSAAKNPTDMYKPLKPIIGIDVGANQVKIVQMKGNGKIKSFGIGNVPEGLINQGKVEAPEPFAAMIKQVMKKSNIKGKNCALCLSNTDVIIREQRLPLMSDKQIRDNIMHSITTVLPLAPSEYSINYRLIETITTEDGRQELRLMVVAVPISLVRSYIKALRKAGLNVKYIDVSANAKEKLFNYVAKTRGITNKRNLCLIDFGASKTDMMILRNGRYFLHTTFSSGLNNLNAIIAEIFETDLFAAEEYKKKINFFNDSENTYPQVLNFFDYLFVDIERAIEFYKNRNSQDDLDGIYISGGGSLLQGLRDYMEEQLGISVHLMSDLLDVYAGRRQKEQLAFFSDAIGVTLRREW